MLLFQRTTLWPLNIYFAHPHGEISLPVPGASWARLEALLPFCVYFENLCEEEHNCSGEQSLATDTVGCLVQCKIAISTVEQWGRVEEMGGREEGEKKRGKEEPEVRKEVRGLSRYVAHLPPCGSLNKIGTRTP